MFLLCRRKAGEMLYKQSRGMMKAAFKDFDYVVYHPFHSRSILKYQTRLIKKEFCTAVVETYDARKVNLTPLEQRKLSFDTHALVKDLLASGFKKEEAEILVTTLVTLTTACMDTVYRDMVTGSHQEIALQQIMAHLDSIKKDMVILEKSEFANLRAENEKMKNELEQVKRQLLEESKKIKADAKLDINLERSRVTDMFTEQEKKLMEVSTEFHKKNAEVDRTTMEAHKKIDIEVASLKVLLESLKLHTARYLAATVFTCLAIALGVYRFWK
ncbi:coiled-coil domain-containing protein 90B, mitochondrial isoform X1 [Erpetoichthys calabaricus]|uniref:Coiled-coil domain containing 90B n=1 Tax=Erpetoichthys calabaricus TaxID=27687 RepID=A0A8C4SB32_ERPCA|nr:coiled-coil domain-containing protein 90B, mitochondrial isoform X1 [Erpetoichthys calabaricus]